MYNQQTQEVKLNLLSSFAKYFSYSKVRISKRWPGTLGKDLDLKSNSSHYISMIGQPLMWSTLFKLIYTI